mmetsp:Transcript_24480/g.66818  ORF Transcript_24480/g.66818 Transcript_24480/m.66818 type:complete len:202 (+) Transcript_24480:828-1433(+)
MLQLCPFCCRCLDRVATKLGHQHQQRTGTTLECAHSAGHLKKRGYGGNDVGLFHHLVRHSYLHFYLWGHLLLPHLCCSSYCCFIWSHGGNEGCSTTWCSTPLYTIICRSTGCCFNSAAPNSGAARTSFMVKKTGLHLHLVLSSYLHFYPQVHLIAAPPVLLCLTLLHWVSCGGKSCSIWRCTSICRSVSTVATSFSSTDFV